MLGTAQLHSEGRYKRFNVQDYEQGLKFVKAILMAEPGNRQAQQLHDFINKQRKKG
jgi:Fis1 C-terminal tetratricopeptide repeat